VWDIGAATEGSAQQERPKPFGESPDGSNFRNIEISLGYLFRVSRPIDRSLIYRHLSILPLHRK